MSTQELKELIGKQEGIFPKITQYKIRQSAR
jgi:hypothetical protein